MPLDGRDLWLRSIRDAARVVGVTLQEQTDLARLVDRPLGTLSGSERQRVTVASALAQEPRLLVFDDPANHLSLLRDLPPMVKATLHDLGLAAR